MDGVRLDRNHHLERIWRYPSIHRFGKAVVGPIGGTVEIIEGRCQLFLGAELAEILRMAFHLRFPENLVKGTMGILDGTPDVGAAKRSGRWRRGRRRRST